ncbi:MAG TPA: beta-1,6-N-acetylglucosaminyltransferase [Acidimicrobiales bacterium]|nr:beta-1,6-N-acetylglucosaminyltransferase [Acidimicrobiales bacterium]
MAGEVAFVVLAHKQPAQVGRLLARLQPNPVFLHVDGRAPESVFRPLADLTSASVRLLPRYKTPWASWNLVEATFAGLRQAVQAGAGHIVALTGQCYPLWPVSKLTGYLSERPGTSWIHQWPIPVPSQAIGDADGGLGRITKWHLTVRGHHLRVPVRRELPAGLEAHYGQMQCCLAAPLARWLLEETGRRPEIVRHFRRTQAPDELLIPTLAMSSPYAGEVTSGNIWYANWLSGGAHPKTLTAEDFQSIADHARSGGDMCGPSPVKLFARKFDQVLSRDLLDRIDRDILGVPPA